MSASQLLRILQTLPTDHADDEICSFNTGELEASMNRSSRCTNPFLPSDKNNGDIDFWNNPQLASSTFGNEFSNNHEDDEMIRKSTAACNLPSDLFDKTTGFQIDKHSVECELPELVVCYQESEFQVKNVCNFEGMPNEEAISIHKNNNDQSLCNSVLLTGDEDDMTDASRGTDFFKHEWLRSPSTIAGCCMDVELNTSLQNSSNNHGPDNLTNTCEAYLNLRKHKQENVFTEQLACNSMLSMQQDWPSLASLQFPLSSNNYANDVNQHPVQGSEEKLFKRAVVGSEVENLSRNGQMTDILDENKMAGSVTFHFNNLKSAKSNDSRGAKHPESIYEFPLETESTLIHQDVASSKLDVANHEMRNVGDSSFSMAGVITELISCSNPMPFAAGISTRSNSSETSSRSFAFPKLETEYVSSPVRMGKSERRLQKNSGWRKGLLCCKS